MEIKMAARGPNEQADLDFINELIFAAVGLDLQPFDEVDLKKGPTPDRRVFKGGEQVAFTELKSPRDDRLDDMLDGTSGELVGYADVSFRDKHVERTARHIAKAARQFRAVNPQRALPKVCSSLRIAPRRDSCPAAMFRMFCNISWSRRFNASPSDSTRDRSVCAVWLRRARISLM